ncbi:hypothetical protein ESP70_007830 [Aeromicrobium ginsengisoli]|uniref:Prokineticin domain-containing protein n=1 Tax=Aeromicrobium ginsengisoli TaxID=363867 RepID=A0A5M4FGK2_9ACTN|nr:hypothetical protein ESP70_007830 [Aeromicrobium ginsengisoli]
MHSRAPLLREGRFCLPGGDVGHDCHPELHGVCFTGSFG